MIRELPAATAATIKAQQYIYSSYIIIKELVENSLDSHATDIRIYISGTIAVEDNGDGVEDIGSIGKPGYTSKEDSTYNVLGVENKPEAVFSHGFRGQALAAIAELCDLTISTNPRNADDNLRNQKAEDGGDRSGASSSVGHMKDFVTGLIKPCAMNKGTTVKVSNLFKNCAIRRRINAKERRKNTSMIITLINSFCYVYDARFVVYEGDRLLLSCQGSSDTIGYAIRKHGEPFLKIEDRSFIFLLFPLCRDKEQVMLLDRRVVSNARLLRIISGAFKKHFDYQPAFVLLLRDEADVNLSVDKGEIVLKSYRYIEARLLSELDMYFSQHLYIHGTQATAESAISTARDSAHSTPADLQILVSQGTDEISNSNPFGENDGDQNKRDRREPDKFNGSEDTPPLKVEDGFNTTIQERSSDREASNNRKKPHVSEPLLSEILSNSDNHGDYKSAQSEISVSSPQPAASALHNAGKQPVEVKKDENGTDGNKNEKEDYEDKREIEEGECIDSAYLHIDRAILEHPNILIKKENFLAMDVIGQFNQGFILCTTVKEDVNYLVVVDQHAADEIYNFEMLKKTFYLKKQRLLAPIDLKLTALQELVVEENRPVLEKNGFMVEHGQLLTIPVYKGVFFTKEDLFSLLENISSGVYESNKFRDLMASKACRSSVMIGQALSMKEMRGIVDNLSRLDLPWNCPHGRPTFTVVTKL